MASLDTDVAFEARVSAMEDSRELPQLVGYAQWPEVPLQLAFEDLLQQVQTNASAWEEHKGFFKGLKEHLDYALQVAKERHGSHPLTSEEIAAVYLYTAAWDPWTDSLYAVLNRTLREHNGSKLKPWRPYLRILLSALLKLKPTKRKLWRGVKEDVACAGQYETGGTITWWGFSSCTCKRAVLDEVFLRKSGPRTQFCIAARSAVSIAPFSAIIKEDEYLLLPGTSFRVLEHYLTANQLRVVKLEEVQDAPVWHCDADHTSPLSSSSSLTTSMYVSQSTASAAGSTGARHRRAASAMPTSSAHRYYASPQAHGHKQSPVSSIGLTTSPPSSASHLAADVASPPLPSFASWSMGAQTIAELKQSPAAPGKSEPVPALVVADRNGYLQVYRLPQLTLEYRYPVKDVIDVAYWPKRKSLLVAVCPFEKGTHGCVLEVDVISGQTVKTYRDDLLRKPSCVTVLPSNQFVVGEYRRGFHVFDAAGNRLLTHAKPALGGVSAIVYYPRNATLHCVSSKNSRVFVFDLNFQYQGKSVSENIRGCGNHTKDGLKNPYGAALVEDTLYIADSGHQRLVAVDLTNTSQLAGQSAPGSPSPDVVGQGMTADAYGRLYVADRKNCRVNVFDKNLKFVARIDDDLKILQQPVGLTIVHPRQRRAPQPRVVRVPSGDVFASPE